MRRIYRRHTGAGGLPIAYYPLDGDEPRQSDRADRRQRDPQAALPVRPYRCGAARRRALERFAFRRRHRGRQDLWARLDRHEGRRRGDRRGGGRSRAASRTARPAWCWSSRASEESGCQRRQLPGREWTARSARRARWWSPSRRQTVRSTAIRACCGWRAAPPASRRMARCRSRATTRCTRPRASSASWSACDLGEGRALKGGLPTLNVGWFRGGMNVNSIPDEATFGLDIRLVPGLTDADVMAKLGEIGGTDASFTKFTTFRPSIPSRPIPGSRRCIAVMAEITGERHAPAIASYFTDAEALVRGYGHPPDDHPRAGRAGHGAPDRRVLLRPPHRRGPRRFHRNRAPLVRGLTAVVES